MQPHSRRLRIRHGRPFRTLTLATALLLGAPAAAHETGRTMTDDELVERATTIVRGQVTDMRSEWSPDRSHIYTIVDIRVDESLKRSVPGNQLKLRLLGGTVGGVAMTVLGNPAFERDEEVLLFLEKNTRSFFPTVGQHEGKLRIATDAQTGAKRVEGPDRPAESFENFRGRINGIVATQRVRELGGGGSAPSTAP